MQRPSSQEADLGATVTMQCKVAGNPTPEIDWIYENSDQVSCQSSILRGMRLIPLPSRYPLAGCWTRL